MKLGCHVSIKEGYLGAAKRAHSLGADAFQYFPKNPRSLEVKTFDDHDAKRCADFCQKEGMVSIAHTPYPTNIAAFGEKKEWVIDSLKNDLEIAEACGSIGIVVHFGSVKGDPLEGYRQMIDTLNKVLLYWNGSTQLLIENNAGKGDQLGTTLEELVKIRELTKAPEKIGFCLDTCHAFSAEMWQGDEWEQLVSRGNELNFISHIKAIHFNNSVYPSGSRKDRHAPLRKGEIPEELIERIFRTSEFSNLPFILETPNTKEWSHEKEIKWMKTLK